jgi:hypothetical protein
MTFRAARLQTWPESAAGDGDRPWQTEPPHDAAPVGTSSAANVIFRSALEYLTIQCEFDTASPDPFEWKRRSTQGFRRKLSSEVGRFERGEDWRGDNPVLASCMASELRKREVELSKLPRGRPQKCNPARPLVDGVIAELHAILETRGAELPAPAALNARRKAATLLYPGAAPKGWDGVAKASGLSVVEGIATVIAERAGIELPPGSIRRAVDDVRRVERRKRARRA